MALSVVLGKQTDTWLCLFTSVQSCCQFCHFQKQYWVQKTNTTEQILQKFRQIFSHKYCKSVLCILQKMLTIIHTWRGSVNFVLCAESWAPYFKLKLAIVARCWEAQRRGAQERSDSNILWTPSGVLHKKSKVLQHLRFVFASDRSLNLSTMNHRLIYTCWCWWLTKQFYIKLNLMLQFYDKLWLCWHAKLLFKSPPVGVGSPVWEPVTIQTSVTFMIKVTSGNM